MARRPEAKLDDSGEVKAVKILVQKFGGTSVATPAQRARAATRVLEARSGGYSPVVVVSAMGRMGEPYATDTLIDLIRKVHSEVDRRELDLVLACGEVISTVVMAQTLRAMGCPAVGLTGAQAGIVTDDDFGNTSILEVRPERVLEHVRDGKVVVVAGFQGVSRSGDITTLGRGGSDTTAAALAVALGAEAIEIYTDVEGIMTADPRIVPDARSLRVMTYREVVEMAHLGAKVVHPRAVEIAMEGGIPIRIRNTFSDEPGTLVTRTGTSPDGTVIRSDKVATGVTHLTNVAQIRIDSSRDVNESGIASRVFRALADAGISVDLINVFPELICFTVSEDVAATAVAVLEGLGIEGLTIRTMRGCAKVSVVGAGMRGVPGVMARVVEALGEAKVPIYQTSDSHASISCLVKKEDMQKAMRGLHARFDLGA
ncbi:MAG: aspartate kinase [Bacteroidota bacterium]